MLEVVSVSELLSTGFTFWGEIICLGQKCKLELIRNNKESG
jgi:hypothetical protein